MTIPNQTATMLPLAFLTPHPRNVRKAIGDISELASSIRQNGLVQPIVVTQQPNNKGRYLILAGHRRHKAAERIGMKQVPCIVRHDVTHITDHLSLMLVENCQRTNLSPVEKAEAIRELLDLGLTQAEIARTTGMHAATVSSLVLITELDEEALEAVKAGDLTFGAAQEAVRKERAVSRERLEGPTRGRPVQVEAPHFRASHPLAGHVRDRCDHSTRPKVGNTGCGQCWEQTIRDDTLGADLPQMIGGGSHMQPPRRNGRDRPVDEVAIERRIAGDRTVELSILEKRHAVELLHSRGLDDGEISRTLGLSHRHMLRIRQELELPANVDAGGNRVTA